ncbi:hypothetical protein F5B19DRAFT_387811 [Rostrohypoxylon terebratum]|nr:hypothetical protein F5B19DRAFT_387811 [Rostrohypoxylon terebratum]
MNITAAIPPDEDLGPALNTIAWTGTIVSTIFVGLRLYSRGFLTRSISWDDGVVVLAALLNIITSAFLSVAIASGFGRHIIYLTDDEITRALYYSVIQRPPGILAYCFPKLSLVTLLCTIMGNAKSRAWFWFLHSMNVVLFVTAIAAFTLFLSRCGSVTALWHPSSPAHCSDPSTLITVSYVHGSWSAFVDGVLASFPIYLLWNLQIKRRQKFIVIAVMGASLLASAAAIVKTTQLPLNDPKDATWDPFHLFISTYIETDLVIIAACTPALPKILETVCYKRPRKIVPQYEPESGNSFSHRLQGYRKFDIEDSSTDMTPLQDDVERLHNKEDE